MRLRSAVVLAAVGVLSGFAAVSGQGQAAGPQTEVLKPGPGIVDPVPVRQPEPKYPLEALRAKIQGSVVLQVVVRADGRVGDIRITQSLDQQYGLDQEAIKAAKQWVFKPATKDGKPVDVVVTLVLSFRFKDDKADPLPDAAASGHVTHTTHATLATIASSPAPSPEKYASEAMRARLAAVAQTADEEFAKGAYTDDTPGLVKPKAISQPEPKYTSQAMREKIQGAVVIEAVVGTDGRVLRARVAQSLDKKFGLDEEAMKAAMRWRFEPGTLDGHRVPVLVELVLMFRLH